MHLNRSSVAALAALISFIQPTHGQESVDFLRPIPELRDLSLKMTEKQLKAHIDRHKLYSRVNTSKDGSRSYWIVTTGGENVFVGFDGEGCLGIQRMSPIPKKLIAGAIGASAFEEWMAKRQAKPVPPPNPRKSSAR